MPGHEQMDRLFLTRAQDMRLLSRAQVLEVYHELGMRRYREPDLQAHEIVVEKGWMGPDVATNLLEAAPGGNGRTSSPELAPADLEAAPDDLEAAPDVFGPVSDHEGIPVAGGETESNLTATEGDFEDMDYGQVPRLVEPLAPTYAVSDSGSEDSVLEMELPPPESASGDSLFEEADSQPGVPSLPAQDDSPEIISERTPSVVYPGHADQLLDPSDTLDDLDNIVHSQEEVEILPQAELAPEADAAPDEQPASVSGRQRSGRDTTSGGISKKGKGKKGKTKRGKKGDTLREPAAASPSDSARRTAQDYDVPGGTVAAEGIEAEPVSPMFENKGSKGANLDFASFGETEIAPPEIQDESEEISVAMVDSAVGDVMADADDNYFGPPADLTITPREVLEDSIAPPRPMSSTTLFDSEQLRELGAEHDLATQDDSDFSATEPPFSVETGSETEAMPAAAQIIKEDSDVDFGATLAEEGTGTPESGVGTVDSEEIILADLGDDISSIVPGKITTSSKTQFATGEMAQPGLGKSSSRLGVESNITGEEMTLADLRQQMGIGAGVKIGQKGETALSRLRKVGGLKKRYSVVREIARGGMGKVIEVEDNDLRRSVALKVLRKEMLGRKDLVERFLEEAQITGQLEHPNIVPVHEIGVDGRGNLYFTMKLVEGEDLSSILKRMKKKDAAAIKAYPVSRLIEIFIKACEGIAFAHSKGVIHRDLKPANVMVGRYGEVQIMDWGVAKIVGRKEETRDRIVASDRQDDDASRTMAGSILGTPSYMSPEQARGEVNNMGPQSDLFSLGVILYELLALKTPWTAQTSNHVLEQVKGYNPEPPTKAAPDRKIPPELDQLAMKCLEKRPEKRIQSVQELVENLRSWQEGRTLAAVEYSVGQLITKWVGRHKVAMAAGLAILLALVIGAGVTMNYLDTQRNKAGEERLMAAEAALKEGDAALLKKLYDDAVNKGTEARTQAEAAEKDLSDDARAKEVARDADNLITRGKYSKEREQADIDKTRQEAERQKKLEAALDTAHRKVEAARDAEKTDMAALATRDAYSEAKDAFTEVQLIDRGNEEAVTELAKINEWLKGFEETRNQQAALNALRGLVEQAKVELATAKQATTFDEATDKLGIVMTTCDQAIGINATSASAQPLKEEAKEIKAEAALECASRAVVDEQFDVGRLMLKTAQGTGKQVERVKRIRDDLNAKVASRGILFNLMQSAALAAKEGRWTQAQTDLQGAITEARASQPENKQLHDSLSRDLENAQVEGLHADERGASVSTDKVRLVNEYDRLIPALREQDIKSRAGRYRDDLRRNAANTMVEEAAAAKDNRVKVELLKRARDYTTDTSLLAAIQKSLNEANAALAREQFSKDDVLLPQGTFTVGSNREGDSNAKRDIKHGDFVFIDKNLVSNTDYKKFVDAGGYENTVYWDDAGRKLLAGKIFLDSTGKPGPKNWADGGFDPSLAKYPVTGVSWYEACAYTKWKNNGKRLPTADEWEIACGAPGEGNPGVQGDYAFGKMDSIQDRLKPVDVAQAREVGTTEWDGNVRGVRDLGTNVAEWTISPDPDDGGRAVVKGAEPGMKLELFYRYARRAKNSVAYLAERNTGRGFRCARVLDLSDTSKDSKDG